MTRKVIYVSYMRLSDKVARDWYINDLINKGVIVEYWDVTTLLFGEDGFSSQQVEFLRVPRTYQELQDLLCLPDNSTASYIVMGGYEGRTVKLYRLLSKYNCRMFYLAWGITSLKCRSDWKDISSRFFSNPTLFLKQCLNKLKAIGYKKFKLINPFDVVFAAGQILVGNRYFANRVVPINFFDYDNYIEAQLNKNKESLVKNQYAVFLDINLPYHSDLKIAGLQPLKPELYYQSINHFFDLLEKKYQIKIVIAAHPKAALGDNNFQGREIFSSRTPELVRDAEFVISHHSASVSYGVLNNKPIVFIYTNEMMRLYQSSQIRSMVDMATYLEASVFNIDSISQIDQIQLRSVNRERYDQYKYNFLTTKKSEHLRTQDIFLRELHTDNRVN